MFSVAFVMAVDAENPETRQQNKKQLRIARKKLRDAVIHLTCRKLCQHIKKLLFAS